MAYGVETVEAVARLINRAVAAADPHGPAGAVAAPEPFHHLVYMQRRFFW